MFVMLKEHLEKLAILQDSFHDILCGLEYQEDSYLKLLECYGLLVDYFLYDGDFVDDSIK